MSKNYLVTTLGNPSESSLVREAIIHYMKCDITPKSANYHERESIMKSEHVEEITASKIIQQAIELLSKTKKDGVLIDKPIMMKETAQEYSSIGEFIKGLNFQISFNEHLKTTGKSPDVDINQVKHNCIKSLEKLLIAEQKGLQKYDGYIKLRKDISYYLEPEEKYTEPHLEI